MNNIIDLTGISGKNGNGVAIPINPSIRAENESANNVPTHPVVNNLKRYGGRDTTS